MVVVVVVVVVPPPAPLVRHRLTARPNDNHRPHIRQWLRLRAKKALQDTSRPRAHVRRPVRHERLNPFHAVRVGHIRGHSVERRRGAAAVGRCVCSRHGPCVRLADRQDIANALESNSRNGGAPLPQHVQLLGTMEKTAEGADAAQLGQNSDLSRVPVGRDVVKSPRRVFPARRVLALHQPQQRRQDSSVQHVLHLVSRLGDVGHNPATLLPDAPLVRGEQLAQARQRRTVNNHLRLTVVPTGNVANDLQRGRLHSWDDGREGDRNRHLRRPGS